jgi:glucose-6-phosphate dehydrogenase assembly protein OpcA
LSAPDAPPVEEWRSEDVRIVDIERALAALRAAPDQVHALRTSVLTLVAWVPPSWHEAAEQVLEGLAERHPSRCLVLYPLADEDGDRIDARVSVESFALPGAEQHIAAEVIRLTLVGDRTKAPGSIVLPLVLPDLPVFLRWRGPLAFGTRMLEQLSDVADRLIVDAAEWDDFEHDLARLPELFDRVAVSDIAWARTVEWRRALALSGAGIAGVTRLGVRGPRPEALLLASWLSSRLGHDVVLEHDEAAAIERVEADGTAVEAEEEEPKTSADLLSEQLEQYARDPVYEASVLHATRGTAPASAS